MAMFSEIFCLLGSVTLFLFGLKKTSREVGELCGGKHAGVIRAATGNRCFAVLAGALSTAVLQSSVATNMIAITFVEKGIIDFVACAAVIMGTNIGTTVTAQLVSLSSVFDFEPGAIGGLFAFSGLILTFLKSEKVKKAGGAALGFGFLFIGLSLMTSAASGLKKYYWFTSLFLVENPFVLFLNGIVVTAVLQSSSVVTGMLIVLSSVGLISFDTSIFLILGANVGTCLPVIFASADLRDEARKAAWFNLAFNVFGSALFFIPLLISPSVVFKIPFLSGGDIGRNIANFHTFFNTVVCLAILPILKPFCGFVEKIFAFAPIPKKKRRVFSGAKKEKKPCAAFFKTKKIKRITP